VKYKYYYTEYGSPVNISPLFRLFIIKIIFQRTVIALRTVVYHVPFIVSRLLSQDFVTAVEERLKGVHIGNWKTHTHPFIYNHTVKMIRVWYAGSHSWKWLISKTTTKRWQHCEHRSLGSYGKITCYSYSEKKMRYQNIAHILRGITLLQWEIRLYKLCVVGNVKRSIWISTTNSHSFTFYISHSAYFFGNGAYLFGTQSQWNYTHYSVQCVFTSNMSQLLKHVSNELHIGLFCFLDRAFS